MSIQLPSSERGRKRAKPTWFTADDPTTSPTKISTEKKNGEPKPIQGNLARIKRLFTLLTRANVGIVSHSPINPQDRKRRSKYIHFHYLSITPPVCSLLIFKKIKFVLAQPVRKSIKWHRQLPNSTTQPKQYLPTGGNQNQRLVDQQGHTQKLNQGRDHEVDGTWVNWLDRKRKQELYAEGATKEKMWNSSIIIMNGSFTLVRRDQQRDEFWSDLGALGVISNVSYPMNESFSKVGITEREERKVEKR